MQEIVINNLSERDKVIHTLSEVQVNCTRKVLHRICDGTTCILCEINASFENCMNQLSDYDRLQVRTLAESKMFQQAPIQTVSTQCLETPPPSTNTLAKSLIATGGVLGTITLMGTLISKLL